MSKPIEHDYIGFSEQPLPSMEKSSDDTNTENSGLRLKDTELRLGLPGSESPEREDHDQNVLSLKSFVSGAKRGFSDALDGGGKWVFSGGSGGGSEGLFSPRRGGNNNGGNDLSGSDSGLGGPVLKDGVAPKPLVVQEKKSQVAAGNGNTAPASKAQVVGWPPIRSFRKNTMASHPPKNDNDDDNAEAKFGSGCLYVKVSMDGAPYLRKVDLKIYGGYKELSSALEKMFSCFTIGQCGSHGVSSRDVLSESRLIDLLHGSEYVLTYEDKDGDWMLVGDVPWEMFTNCCKRLRIMKSTEAIGLAPRAMEKSKTRT